MTVYVIMDGILPSKAYKSIEFARQQMDAMMFTKCKRGYRILESKNDSYTYSDGNTAVKYRLYLTEVELVG